MATRLGDRGLDRAAGRAVKAVPRPAQAVDRALTTLEILASDPHTQLHSLTSVARQLGTSKSTAHRLLAALMSHDFVAQDEETRKYRLGWGLYRLAHRVPDRGNIYAAARPLMEEAGRELQETVNLGYRDGTQVIIVESWSSRQGLTIETAVGVREPIHATALGKSLLMDFDSEVVGRLAGTRYEGFTGTTLTTLEALMDDIAASRERGYTLDNEEFYVGIRCVGAPVRDHTGKVVAAVSISGPAQRLTGERFDAVVSRVGRLARDVSRALGFAGASVFKP